MQMRCPLAHALTAPVAAKRLASTLHRLVDLLFVRLRNLGNDDAGCGIHIGKARFSADEIPVDVVLNELHST